MFTYSIRWIILKVKRSISSERIHDTNNLCKNFNANNLYILSKDIIEKRKKDEQNHNQMRGSL